MNFEQYRQAVQMIYATYRDDVATAQLAFDRAMGEAFALFRGDNDSDMESVTPDTKRAYRG